MKAPLIVALLIVCGCTHAAEAADAVDTSLSALAGTFSEDVQDALRDIDGTPRRLLAMRGYLRARDTLHARWSWSESQIEAFEKSPRYMQMLADIAKVDARFRQANPGYSLLVNTQVRSLGVQLERWNKNRTVGKVADDLEAAVRQSAAGASSDALGQFLADWTPTTPIPLAAPGLSLHGQSKALDFQVRAGARLIAGPDTSTVAGVWERQGWARKLAAAVNGSADRFKGPLKAPHEPWHFEYAP